MVTQSSDLYGHGDIMSLYDVVVECKVDKEERVVECYLTYMDKSLYVIARGCADCVESEVCNRCRIETGRNIMEMLHSSEEMLTR